MIRLYVYYILYIQIVGYGAFETASFYGASYVNVPLQEAKSTTDIYFKFRTKQTDALLFLAAGKTDYCLIRLQAGKLKIHINLGAGESEISSPKGLRFDDLLWHQVSMTRKDVEVNLTIDRIYNTRQKLPDRFSELNIFYGVYLGSVSDSLDLFLGHFDSLRGCLSSVLYNGYDILKRARYRLNQSDAHSVTWVCSAEFDAMFENEISFVEEGAYISLPNPISRTGIRWQFELRTTSKEAILLYSSKLVAGGRTDYVGLEILNEKLHLVVDTGSGSEDITNDALIVDGQWHLVTIYLNRSVIGIEVNGSDAVSSHPINHIGNKYLDLSDTIYIGGLELNKRASALSLGMKSAGTSFKGCIRNIHADGKPLGIPNAKVTQGILSTCAWRYPCFEKPCIPGAFCSQFGLDSFQCSCSKSVCVNPNYSINNKNSLEVPLPVLLEILSLNVVHVTEGEKVPITADNINVIWDFAKYSLTDRKIVFYQTLVPHFGKIFTNSITHHQDFTYTFADLLSGDKIYYSHDGSENFNDTVKFDFEFIVDRDQQLPQYLRGRHSFFLDIEIAPVNDPPLLIISENKIFSLAQGTRRIITSEYLNATDVDNLSSDLWYTVFNQSNSDMNGHVEFLDAPEVPIYTFTQADVDEKKVVYKDLNNKKNDINLPLQVTDGMFSTQAAFLHISVYPLQLRLINNTGLTLVHQTEAIITSSNLAFGSNSDDPSLRIDFQVIDEPRYGVILLNGSDKGKKINHFTNEDLLAGRIRYQHIREMPLKDRFNFQGSVNDRYPSDIYEFEITFVQLNLKFNSNEVVLNEGKKVTINELNLNSETEPISLNRSSITYVLLKIPAVSNLLLSQAILKVNDTWTQQDVLDNKLQFDLHFKTYSPVKDDIMFMVNAPYCDPEGPASLTLLYNPPKYLTDTVQVLIQPVKITEGGQQPLLLENLSIVKDNIIIYYKVLDGPRHGYLDLYNSDLVAIEKHNISQFTSTDLMKQRITLVHDDSESRADNIKFVAYGSLKEDFQYIGNLPIDISLKNDNPPYCVTNTGLHVVIDGEKLLTKRNLMFADADVDAAAENITYTRQMISNGAFVLSIPPHTPLFEFTQDDINNERVLFRHSGLNNSSTSMWVSDGERYSEITFEIFASAPFIKILNNTRFAVKEAGRATISGSNLFTDTNLNVPLKNIRYQILSVPINGMLTLQDSESVVTSFTQEQIDRNLISYRHTAFNNNQNRSSSDKFEFEVSVSNLFEKGIFQIKIFSAIYFEPLVLVNNKTVEVEESTSVLITRDELLVTQKGIPPSDILYVVTKSPKYGYLEIDGINTVDDSKDNVLSFDQQMIDGGKLHYVHLVTNQSLDFLILDVTNGIRWLNQLNVTFLVIPEHFYIGGGNLHVEESGFVTLPPSLFSVQSPNFFDRILGYKLRKHPKHGYLQQYTENGMLVQNITRWTISQLKNSRIQYVHDNSETMEDSFSVVAYTESKESVPAIVRLHIQPINDEPPILVNNTGLTVWRGGLCNITSSNLAVADKDTSNNNLTYVVLSAKGGHLSFYSHPNVSIDKFTQAHIDNKLMSFVHYGEDANAEFDVMVSDGAHNSEPIQVIVKTIIPKLQLSRNNKLQIFPLMKKPITADLLLSTCTDFRKEVIYAIVYPPVYGVLLKEQNGESLFVSRFSQADLNTSLIWYQHTSRLSEPVTKDRFTFSVLSDFADAIDDQIFNIEIGVSFGGLNGLFNIDPIKVVEGGQTKLVLNTSNVIQFLSESNIGISRPILKASVTLPPERGTVCVQKQCGTDVKYFTNEQLNDGSVTYHHDHSDTVKDKLILTIYLEPRSIPLSNVTVPVIVEPVNDQPFHLAQDSPSLTVVQGGTITIGRDHLLTIDADTSPSELIYDIINRPNCGNLSVNRNNSAVSFTQEDVDRDLVQYSHFGPAQSCSFYFRVWDGHFQPVYKLFEIYVQLAQLNIVVNDSVVLMQGSNSTVIAHDIFTIRSNLKTLNALTFNVTFTPRYGYILVNGILANAFTYDQLIARKVLYTQTNLNSTDDQFRLSATFPFDNAPTVSGLKVNVTVEPLVKIGKFSPVIGTKSVINTDVLNANGLAKLFNANPVFMIVEKPQYGRLKKIVRTSKGAYSDNSSSAVREREVSKFTHEELKSGVIYYAAKKLPLSASDGPVEDRFVYNLSVPAAVQPAIGELRFTLLLSADTNNGSTVTTPLPNVTAADVGNVSIRNRDTIPNMTNDSHFMALTMLLVIFKISLIFVYLLRCRSKKRAAEEDFKINPPLPLPRPPDDLMPSSPHPNKAYTSFPSLKVIPLALDNNGLNSVGNNFSLGTAAGYPYGTTDEDWSSCDASDGGYSNRGVSVGQNGSGSINNNNPMLRRNQYWV